MKVEKFESKVLKSQNDVTVFSDGNVTISQRKLAELLGVSENAVSVYIHRKHKNYSTNNGLDAFIVGLVSTHFAYKSRKTTKEAQCLVDKLIEAGAKAFLYHEAGYTFEAKQNNPIAEELAKAQAKLAYCSIDDNCPKAVFKLRSNKKVNLVYNDWVNIGWLVERRKMVEQIDYLMTPEGSERLYFEEGNVRVKSDMHHETRLITHGARLAITGQSDLFVTD
jgi:predicted transcriptional regulator